MSLMMLTQSLFVNPAIVAYISFRPSDATSAASMRIAFTNNLIPLTLDGDQAEEALRNWKSQPAAKQGGRHARGTRV